MAEKWSLHVAATSSRTDPGVELLLEARMTGHVVALTAFFMPAEPPAFAMLEVIDNLHVIAAPTRAKL
jgi:hypothetical protein